MERYRRFQAKVLQIGAVGMLGVLVPTLILFVPEVFSAGSCNQRATVKEKRALYDRPPSFDTGHGWRLGKVVYRAQRGDRFWICRKKTIGFGFSTQRWYQVGFVVGGNKKWRYGWIQGEYVTPAGYYDGVPRRETPWFSASVAFAQTPETADGSGSPPIPDVDDETEDSLSDTPPLPSNGVEDSEELPLPTQTSLYLFMFAAMALGIIAKGVVDFLQSWGDKQRRAEQFRQAIIPFFISPMVFLSFMQTAELQFQGQKGFIVLLLLAFQNGFFWQAIFSSRKAR